MADEVAATAKAGFWERFLAFAIDLIAVRVLALAAFLAARAAGSEPPPGVLASILLVVFLGYHALWRGATPGKRALGLRVVDDGERMPNLGRALVRAIAYLLGIATLGGSFLWCLVDAEGRAVHDRLARTRVVSTRSRGALGRTLVYLFSAGFIALNAVPPLTRRLVEPELDKAEIVDAAQRSLDALASLEDRRKARIGDYTDDVPTLAAEGGDRGRILAALSKVFADGRVAITLSGDGYELRARARDREETPVVSRGPKSAAAGAPR